jgi:excisionase family DNA binding protein
MQSVTITQITPPELESLIECAIRKVIGETPKESKPETDELLTVQDAATLLRLSVPTIYGLISKGDLPVMKRSKRCYFSKIELLNYLKEGRKKTFAETASEADKYLKNKKGLNNGK